MSKGPVTQGWTHEIPMMQQAVLMGAIRGPDGQPKYGPVKMLLRWYRRAVLLSAMQGVAVDDPYTFEGGSFMGPSLEGGPLAAAAGMRWEDGMDQVLGDYLKDLDAIPHHFQLHFLHAAEIVGYKHPDLRIREWWQAAYVRLVHDMHLFPESEWAMDRRLGDDRSTWLERADPATVA